MIFLKIIWSRHVSNFLITWLAHGKVFSCSGCLFIGLSGWGAGGLRPGHRLWGGPGSLLRGPFRRLEKGIRDSNTFRGDFFDPNKNFPRTSIKRRKDQANVTWVTSQCTNLGVFFSFFFLKSIIYLLEREHEPGGGAGGKGESLKRTPHWAKSLTRGSIPAPWDHD